MTRLRAFRSTIAVCALVLLAALAPAANANRALITEKAVDPKGTKVPEEQIEGACGVAHFGGTIYVSDYYHGRVEAFPGAIEQYRVGTPPEGPCGLAVASTGALYANAWHESVIRVKPSLLVFDEDSSTGVAVDANDSSNNVYVNDRTRVVKYAPSGALIEEIGAGSLFDAYGLAVFMGRVYVPDAASGTVKVFEPAKSSGIVDTIAPPGGFTSLVDASVAVDPTNGHVLVVDNLQPGFEHPNGGIDEFDDEGNFLGQLGKKVIDGGPSGIAVSATGTLYVTSGNSENSTVFAFGTYTASGLEATDSSPEDSALAVAGPPVPEVMPTATGGSAKSIAPQRLTPRRAHRHRRSRARRVGLAEARAAP